jgi:hypothetical protein
VIRAFTLTTGGPPLRALASPNAGREAQPWPKLACITLSIGKPPIQAANPLPLGPPKQATMPIHSQTPPQPQATAQKQAAA